MSVFHNPAEHAANPPDTWQVVKVAERAWQLQTAGGGTLSQHTTRRAAISERECGFIRDLYDKETRWYAGEDIPGWRPYTDLVH